MLTFIRGESYTGAAQTPLPERMEGLSLPEVTM